MTDTVELLRSLTPGARPIGKPQGQLFVNFADRALGVSDGARTLDLTAVRFFSANGAYQAGDVVSHEGGLWVAKSASAGRIFNEEYWAPVMTARKIRDYGGFGGFVNKIRNPCFDLWQRGGSFSIAANTAAWTADGWIVWSNGAASTVTIGGGPRTRHSLIVTGAAGVTTSYIGTRIESVFAAPLDGRAITFQAQIWNNTGSAFTPTFTVDSCNVTDNSGATTRHIADAPLQPCLPTSIRSWNHVARTFTLPDGASRRGLCVYVTFGSALNGASRAVAITEVDMRATPGLPVGLCYNPPPPELRPPGAEMPYAFRYHYVAPTSYIWSGAITNGAGYWCNTNFIMGAMRAVPTLTRVDGGASGFQAGVTAGPNVWANGFQFHRTANATQNTGWHIWGYTASAEF